MIRMKDIWKHRKAKNAAIREACAAADAAERMAWVNRDRIPEQRDWTDELREPGTWEAS